MRIVVALAGLAALAACDGSTIPTAADIQLSSLALEGDTRRFLDDTFLDVPFDGGTVYVVAEEHGDLHTYGLTACGGDHICGASGHVGHVERTDFYYVVTGAYPHRTFYLSPGGDGYLKWRGVNRDLAWN